MSVALRLSLEQVSAAILLLAAEEKRQLKERLPLLLSLSSDEIEDMGWLRQAESAFSFWDDPAEDVYNCSTNSTYVSCAHSVCGTHESTSGYQPACGSPARRRS
jgi:hypothetical protein